MAWTSPEEVQMKQKDGPLTIIGVGASAGGIKAFQSLLNGVPADTDAAIVLIIHLDPKRQSGVPDALASSSKLPVLEAADGLRVEAGHVYVIPANTTLTLRGDRFHTVSPRPPGPTHAIDAFLSSLAEEAGHRAVGVVLSGTADDGAEGLRAIKQAGGFTFAQDQSAEFQGMPSAAKATGAVDRVMAPELIVPAALELMHAAGSEGPAAGENETDEKSALAPVVERLKKRAGIDFFGYKPGTLSRRLRRRMALLGDRDIGTYVARLDRDEKELDQLVEDVLINVTSFFRDAEALKALREHVFPEFLQGGDDEQVRIWVPGCATGEEAYSLAMAFTEFMEETGQKRSFKVFATDVDGKAIVHARNGVYTGRALERLSPERRARFFDELGPATYVVGRNLREHCVFARHDLLSDPPFARLDLISCRNVLIYFAPDVQRRLLPVFHYALRRNGFLHLGPAETVGDSGELFKEVDRRHRIYRRAVDETPRPSEGFPFAPRRKPTPVEPTQPSLLSMQEEADLIRLQAHAPPGLVIDGDGRVLLVLGDPTPYLRLSPGRPDTTADKLVRDDLQPDLASVLEEARSGEAPVRRERVPFEAAGEVREVTLAVYPMEAPQEAGAHLVLFEAAPRVARPSPEEGTQAELLRSAMFRERLRHRMAMRRLEATNEELRTAHEEFLTVNEEYQLTNEELETAKEELQSSYEELTTVNDQLRAHTDELERLYSDLENVMASLKVPILIVDENLAIQRVTDPGHSILRAIPADVGRSLDDLHTSLVGTDLPAIVRSTVESGEMQEQEVRDASGRWHALRVRPYAAANGERRGAVIVLLDIDAQKHAAFAYQRARDLAETIIDISPAPVVLLDAALAVVRTNDAFGSTFDCDASAIRGQSLFKLARGRLDIPRLRRLVTGAVERHEPFADVVVEHNVKGLGERTLVFSGRPLPPDEERPEMLLLTVIDETERRKAARDLANLREDQVDQLVELNQFKAEFIGMAAHEMAAPITPLQIQLKMIEKGGSLQTTQAKALEVAKRNVASLQFLVKDMLAAARFQSGRLEVDAQPMDLGELVGEVAQTYQAVATEKGIALDVETEPLRIQGDAHLIERVVSNLLSNAIKYTPSGGEVHVRATGHKDRAVLEVKDTGLGLSKESLQDLFKPFRRLHEGKSDAAGTGLGLYISHGIAQLHGGTLAVASKGADKGVTFTLTLPRAAK